MGKIRSGAAWLLLCVLLGGCAHGEVPISPLTPGFSLGWQQLRRAYQRGETLHGSQKLQLSALSIMDERAFALLSYALESMRLEFDLQADAKRGELFAKDASLFSFWQTQDDYWRTYGSSLLPEDALSLPRQQDPTQTLAYQRLESLPGLGTLWTNPLSRYLTEVTDFLPLVDLFLRQWAALQIKMTPYADENITKSGMGGTDPHGHCTTYIMDSQAVATALSLWISGLGEDPALRWLFDYSGMDEDARQAYGLWFQQAALSFARATVSRPLNLRVYLDGTDAVCGITGSCTIQTESLRIPVSVTYRKKTNGNKVNHSLQLDLQPNGTADGISMDIRYVTSDNGVSRTGRSLTATFTGYWRQLPYRIKLSWDYENLWTADAGNLYTENILGEGAFELRYDGAKLESLTWSQVQQLVSNPRDLSQLSVRDTLTFQGIMGSGTLETSLSFGEGKADLWDAHAVTLAQLEEASLAELRTRLDDTWSLLFSDVFSGLFAQLLQPFL